MPPWAFALLCRELQWRRGGKSTVQGIESGCSQSSVMSRQSSTTEVSLEASGSLFNLYKIMDMMPWGFCCCFFVVVFCVLSTEARQWGPQAVGTEMTSFSKDLPSALEFIWEANCEEISAQLYSQPCCRLGIAPDHPPARHFCSSWALLSSPCLPKATQGQDTNITNSTKDPEGSKLPQSHPLQPLWLTSDSCVTRHSGICAMTPTQS